jgi:TolB-like protein
MNVTALFAELRRRRVFRALALYAAVAWALIQGISMLKEPFGLSPTMVRAFITGLVALTPVVVLLAWAYDLTAKGLVRASDLPTDGAQRTPFWLAPSPWLALAAGVLFVVAANNAWQVQVARTPAERVAVAVLPFANLGGRAEDQGVVDGLHDAVIGELSANPNLAVATRYDVLYVAATVVDPEKVAQELRAQYVMEGSVRRDGTTLELEVRLSKPDAARVVWRQLYRRPLADALVIQRELATAVSDALWVAATPRELLSSARPADPKAVDLYLRARDTYSRALGHPKPVWIKMTEQIDEAVRIDPGFGAAWAFLARIHARRSASLGDGSEYREHMPLARAAVARAEALDPNSMDAAVAWTYLAQHEGDYPLWLASAERARRLNPGHPEPSHRLLHAYENLGRYDEAIGVAMDFSQREPYQKEWWHDLGDLLRAVGRFDEAQRAYERLIPLDEGLAKNRFWANRFCATGDLLQGIPRDQVESQIGSIWDAVQLGYPVRGLELAKARWEKALANGLDPTRATPPAHDYSVALYLNGKPDQARRIAEPIATRLLSTPIDDVQPPRRPYHFMGRATFGHLAGRPETELRAALDSAMQQFPADDVSPLAEHSRRQIAAYYAFTLADGARVVEILGESLRRPSSNNVNGCPWSIWRDMLYDPIRDYPPFRELMARHGVDVGKGVYDYSPAATTTASATNP